ncbi:MULTISPECIES: hypothetical protein [unclassified Mesorhizobium]|uniref:hypothetical protein n=1 Tax=unclassified Mesorhizobium TaxID=325217 RepID=UPI001129634F|nr:MULTISPECIES: hypothetical protein [unclassified Mesorhizobium]MCA0000929.1 hypothetical protein [Mesorhizobium sp. B264B2A]MCA0004678.1 hypothetical protein [Mesorhizobium sp. B264B1B]MCA0019123.1 hypothetical protein [Mesorhizobium sp. B264B1A]TPJ38159.1 hypothetical protein FJ437_30740 [Mesorhizobium sp. B2-6-6]
MTKTTRKEMLVAADTILKANPLEKSNAARIRFRGGRPAWNWLAKHDESGAAALWLLARERLPKAANDNLPTEAGLNVDRSRKDGKPRGRNPDPRSLEAYMALPSVKPRLGDAEPEPARMGNWDGASRGVVIKPQRGDFEFSPDCRFGFCGSAIAPGAIFLGSIGGLGRPKQGKSRGDTRFVDAADAALPPAAVDTVIEVILSGGNVADVGKAFGARGGYADRRGGAELLAAGRWAKLAVANDNRRVRAA